MAYKNSFNNYNAVDEDNPLSKFNSAGLINSTLERLWLDCYNAMAKGEYSLWNTKLDAIWAILGGDEKEGNAVDEEMNKINLKVYETGTLKSKIGVGFQQKSNPQNGMQYHLLLGKSLFLRRLQNKQGKGTAYINEDEDDFD